MTTHYIEQLGVAKCREILKGAPDWAFEFCMQINEYIDYSDVDADFCDHCVKLKELTVELALHDTDDFKHLANHISPMTVVLENNLQEQFQEANEAECGR